MGNYCVNKNAQNNGDSRGAQRQCGLQLSARPRKPPSPRLSRSLFFCRAKRHGSLRPGERVRLLRS